MKTWLSIKEYWSNISSSYSNLEWLCIKLPLVYLWIKAIISINKNYRHAPIPNDLCRYISCDFFVGDGVSLILTILVSTLSLLYLLEKKMIWTTLLMFIIMLLFVTIEESNGSHLRRGLLTFIFFAQFLAYFFARFKGENQLKNNRIQFSIQVVVVGYMLAAFSKLWQSGLDWVSGGRFIPIQVIKSFHYRYLDFGDRTIFQEGVNKAEFLLSNQELVMFFLITSLMLEAFTFLAFLGKKYSFIYGILLLLMHVGIFILMDIAILDIVYPMMILLINPIYVLLIVFKKATYRISL